MLFQLVQDNFVAVAITLFLILFILTNNNFERRTNLLFLASACCVLVLIFTETWEAQLSLSPVYEPLRVPLSAIGYTLRPTIPFLLTLMARGDGKPRSIPLALPLIFNTLAAFSALFCGLSFRYTADNQFVRGPLGVSPFVVSALYIAILLTLTIRTYRNGGRAEALIISAIVLLAFTSTVMESLFHFRFIQNPCIATSITFYYLFLHSNQSNRDPLTGALTRRRFYLDSQKYSAALTAVISLDLNDLKTINDQQGHLAGDRALTAVAGVITQYTGPQAALYRTGGDEFMILCFKLDEGRVRELISGIGRDLEQAGCRCAIGYALHAHQANFDSVCQAADDMMYENKRQMKFPQAAP